MMTIPEGASVVACLVVVYRWIDGFQTKKDARTTSDAVKVIGSQVEQTGAAVQQARLEVAANTTITREVKSLAEETNGRVTKLEVWREVVESKPKRRK